MDGNQTAEALAALAKFIQILQPITSNRAWRRVRVVLLQTRSSKFNANRLAGNAVTEMAGKTGEKRNWQAARIEGPR